MVTDASGDTLGLTPWVMQEFLASGHDDQVGGGWTRHARPRAPVRPRVHSQRRHQARRRRSALSEVLWPTPRLVVCGEGLLATALPSSSSATTVTSTDRSCRQPWLGAPGMSPARVRGAPRPRVGNGCRTEATRTGDRADTRTGRPGHRCSHPRRDRPVHPVRSSGSAVRDKWSSSA